MKVTQDEIRQDIREYMLKEFLPGENPEALKDSTPLITSGILDSINMAKFVTFLEERFDVEIDAREMTVDYLNTIDDITGILRSKLDGD